MGGIATMNRGWGAWGLSLKKTIAALVSTEDVCLKRLYVVWYKLQKLFAIMAQTMISFLNKPRLLGNLKKKSRSLLAGPFSQFYGGSFKTQWS